MHLQEDCFQLATELHIPGFEICPLLTEEAWKIVAILSECSPLDVLNMTS
jgi:hypothetical protein